MSEKTNRDSDKFMLRLPDGLRDRVKVVAEANRHSMNAEIIDAIERHIDMEEYRLNDQPEVSPELKAYMLSEMQDATDPFATKADIDKLYEIIKVLADKID